MSEFQTTTGATPFDNAQESPAVNVPAVMDEDERFIMDLTAERKVQFCSMNNPEERIGDCINKVLNVRHIYCEIVTCINRETGESNLCPRVVLIDDNGKGYQAVSLGVFSALKKIFSIKGNPATWKKPVKLEVKQITKGDRKLLTFNMVK